MDHNEKLAYVAGIMDGEGCFSIYHNKPLDRHFITIDIYNSCIELLKWLSENFPGEAREIKAPSKKIHTNWKPQYIWRSNNRHTLQFLRDIFPFLLVKKKQCELAIQFRESFGPNGRILSPETRELRRRLYDEMKVLNQRGIIIVPPCLPPV